MSDYRIFTDSGCDIDRKTLEDWGVVRVDLTFMDSEKEYPIDAFTSKEFYDEMRGGRVFKTSAPAPEKFEKAFREALDQGLDVLYVGFSTGLSAAENVGRMVAEDLKNEYPDRHFYVIDTLCASAGEGLVLYYAVQNKKNGFSLQGNGDNISMLAPKVCHWFTVSDLIYLKRGGRISTAAYFAATALNIKPVMHVDDAGHLIGVKKVRGRQRAIEAMAERYVSTALDPENGIYFISHGDCIDDVHYLEDLIEFKCGHRASYIADVGPVIGSHSGPGTLALFFLGSVR
ncbi:MAG: DegV family protein [Lachnospiraceae bacterium]|nr:DegV family protein [Lachnospiraceae bacterium]